MENNLRKCQWGNDRNDYLRSESIYLETFLSHQVRMDLDRKKLQKDPSRKTTL